MPETTIITDSSACIPPSVAEELGIRVVPIAIHLRDGDFLDGAPEAARRVYDAIERDEPVKSSAPSPIDYLRVLDSLETAHALIVTPATEFTTMRTNATLASEMAIRTVTVLDSRTAAAAQGLIVITAARLSRAGASVEEVIEAAQSASRRAELVAKIERPDILKKAGRVGSPALGAAGGLQLRPVFRMRRGAVEPLATVQSVAASLSSIRREWKAAGGEGAECVGVFHSSCEEHAQRLCELLGTVDFVTEFNPSMGIHTGPGVVGVAWLRTRVEE